MALRGHPYKCFTQSLSLPFCYRSVGRFMYFLCKAFLKQISLINFDLRFQKLSR